MLMHNYTKPYLSLRLAASWQTYQQQQQQQRPAAAAAATTSSKDQTDAARRGLSQSNSKKL
jgi:hypothetical protein